MNHPSKSTMSVGRPRGERQDRRAGASPSRATTASAASSSGTVGFIGLAVGVSWALWGVAAISEGTWYGQSAQVAGSFGPAVAAVAMLRRQGGWLAARRALSRLVRLRGAVMTTVVALLLPPAIAAAGWWLDRLLGGRTAIVWPSLWVLPVVIVYVLVLGGPLGEELGWRGYLLPRLERRVGPGLATLIVGVVWAVWHLPLFALGGTVQAAVPIGLFGVQIMVTSFVYAWLVHRSPASLVPSLAFHTSFNISVGTVLLHPAEAPASRPLLLALVVAGLVAAALSATPTFRRTLGPSKGARVSLGAADRGLGSRRGEGDVSGTED